MTFTVSPRALAAFVAGALLALTVSMTLRAFQADASDERATMFVPTSPCRLVDTRPGEDQVGPHGAFSPSDTKTIMARGQQGECVIPSEAVGLALNMTAVGASAVTFLTVWDSGDRPNASSLNPAPAQPPTPNAVEVPLAADGSFRVFNRFGTVNVVIDVTGYYVTGSVKALESRTSKLERAMPFTVSAYTASANVKGPFVETVASVTVAAPAAGQVTVISSGVARLGFAGAGAEEIQCSISDAEAIDEAHEQLSSGVGTAQLAGVRTFDQAAGTEQDYHLMCTSTSGSPSIVDVSLTAMFTPAR